MVDFVKSRLSSSFSLMFNTVIWASPFPDLSDTGRSPSHITLVIWFRVTGDTHITRVLGMGMPVSL